MVLYRENLYTKIKRTHNLGQSKIKYPIYTCVKEEALKPPGVYSLGTFGSRVALPGPGRFLPLFLLFRGGTLLAALISSVGSSGAKE